MDVPLRGTMAYHIVGACARLAAMRGRLLRTASRHIWAIRAHGCSVASLATPAMEEQS